MDKALDEELAEVFEEARRRTRGLTDTDATEVHGILNAMEEVVRVFRVREKWMTMAGFAWGLVIGGLVVAGVWWLA